MTYYNIGDLIVFNDKSEGKKYTGIIVNLTKDKDWWGGGYYTFDWEYPENFQGIKDGKVSYDQLITWVQNKEAKVYLVRK